jgi:hypothetical protein
MRVPELYISMGKSAVCSEFAVTLIVKLAFDGLVIAVRLRVEELLLFTHFCHIVIWQRHVLFPQLILPVSKVTMSAPLATKASDEVLAKISLKLLIDSRKLRRLGL